MLDIIGGPKRVTYDSYIRRWTKFIKKEGWLYRITSEDDEAPQERVEGFLRRDDDSW